MADTSATTGLNSLIAQYGTDSAKIKAGVATDSSSSTSSSDSLADKNVFMELYIAQLKNQDPTAPQETGDMVSQMAEFSSLEQLTDMSSTMTSMSEALVSSQALTASTLVGKSVYVDQDTISYDGSTDAYIKATIPSDSSATTVTITDSDGNVVRTDSLDSDGKYTWDGEDDSGEAVAAGDYSVSVTSSETSGEVTQLTSQVASRINGVSLNGTDGTSLNINGYGTLKLTDTIDIIG
ncbi:flagellar hook assembly protein FlgD [Marinomonas mediterranea]|jgi:Flagellar hook capping protein|uniref:Basal-body rod modification protein FlgD n=1 Tax=Marinomonas mediterranea (strain ATCC 700492 / JCM 21426 / NBRC 103028 / MMB-1) TaxID=717774 RepID=F2K4T9_MARM1|nr:flagellar hook capping FlgD N-terminal domain-containing protein [Marinomonas mediterranea]ADZ92582.1 flagellar hook capping protein [Marinomonas mediterranea MMB-1]WCN10525.1 flagellar biosynthesis protein FlgD [Marinomonas mediterranea]WCN14575.1 flagellar biosynthesis protein FlgD [Marinomonas mediterranea]WCN18624.1 flagellar biosynthesis protein FlgD [Marinomonas mediterranea MMB-1]